MCEYLEFPYEMHHYSNPYDWVRDKKEFLDGNFPLANLPYLEDKEGLGDERVSDALAIMVYLA